MRPRVVILGAGFAGLELAAILSDEFGADIDVTLIDKHDAFVFGFAKLDVQFGDTTLDAISTRYSTHARPGVRFAQETVTAIDPEHRRVTTDHATHDADYLVIALGADYNLAATPGLEDSGGDLYSVGNSEQLARHINAFTSGHAVIGVTSQPYKCTPAPSEAALLLHDNLVARGCRDACDITLVLPMPSPVPPSADSSRALLEAFAERRITFIPGHGVSSFDVTRHVVALDDGSELACDLYLGVPKHVAPRVVIDSGLGEGNKDGFITVNAEALETRFPGVHAVGDVTTIGGPKAGVFAEKQGRVAAAAIIAAIRGGGDHPPYDGRGSCYIEFGGGRVGRVDVDGMSGPKPTGVFHAPTPELSAEKRDFSAARLARWFRA